MDADPEIEVVVVSYQVVYWRFSNGIPGFLGRHAIMIQECHMGYACRTGWKMTDSPSSFLDEFVVGVNINIML